MPARVNMTSLRDRASILRAGIACTITSDACSESVLKRRMGGQNYHLELSFADGASWICRVQRHNASTPPIDVQNRVLLSEAATLRFLTTTTRVPVPRVFDVAAQGSDNDVGVGYILMEKIEGHPLCWNDLDSGGKQKVLERFAIIFAEISRHTFPAIGCIEHPDSLQVGPLVHARTATRDESGGIHQQGPFNSALDMYLSFAKHQLESILNEEIYVDEPVIPFLVYRYLIDILPTILLEDTESETQFFVKHVDDKGDHILVDDELNITGIIDWEWAQTLPKQFAFCAPAFMLSVVDFYEGKNNLSEDESMFASILERNGRDDLAHCIRNGRKYQRVLYCLEEDVGYTEAYMYLLWGLRQLMGLAEHGEASRDWEAWKMWAEREYAQDRDFGELQRRIAERK